MTGIPTWHYEAGGCTIEKRVLLLHGQNTVYVSYSLLSGQDSISVELRPSVHFRPHERDVSAPLDEDYILSIQGKRYEIAASGGQYPLRLTVG